MKVTWPTDFQCMTGEWWGAKINCPRTSCEVKKSLGSVTRVFVVIICIWCICYYKPNYPSLSKFQPTFQWLRIQFLMPSMDHFRRTISAGVFHTLPFLSWRTLYVINSLPPPIPFWGWFIVYTAHIWWYWAWFHYWLDHIRPISCNETPFSDFSVMCSSNERAEE